MKTTKPFLSGSIALLLLLTSIFIYSCRKIFYQMELPRLPMSILTK
ncbi:hypothetical protein LT679_12450 [Mucilaginibacter roseus]|uniref:Lipoprotein n=1 Tax=Mucilaginibacter roseus TaxID=1528868 RepID=A0ABS8U2S0_9SPHI|nr:hypothetical protein [Mucilaginibacter roseus]MCD8741418.1 hypothetical protein [Mucilaginibacter roseus]